MIFICYISFIFQQFRRFLSKKNIFYSSIYISISLGLLHEICLYWFFMRKMFIFSLQLSLKSCKSWNKPLKYLNWTNCSQSVSEVRNYILKYLNCTNCSQSVSEVRNYILQHLNWTNCSQSVSEVRNYILQHLNWTNCSHSQSVSEVRNYILQHLNWTNCSQSVSKVSNYILKYLIHLVDIYS